MSTKKKILLGGASLLLFQGVATASFFVFSKDTEDAVVDEGSAKVAIVAAVQSMIPEFLDSKENGLMDRLGETRQELVSSGNEFLEINFSQNKVCSPDRKRIKCS